MGEVVSDLRADLQFPAEEVCYQGDVGGRTAELSSLAVTGHDPVYRNVAHDGEWLLDGSDAKLEKIEGPGSPALTDVFSRELDSEIANCRRFWPEETGTQGFFVAKVVKP